MSEEPKAQMSEGATVRHALETARHRPLTEEEFNRAFAFAVYLDRRGSFVEGANGLRQYLLQCIEDGETIDGECLLAIEINPPAHCYIGGFYGLKDEQFPTPENPRGKGE